MADTPAQGGVGPVSIPGSVTSTTPPSTPPATSSSVAPLSTLPLSLVPPRSSAAPSVATSASSTPTTAPSSSPTISQQSSTMTSTSPTSSAAPSPSAVNLSFSTPSNFTSCGSGILAWSYEGTPGYALSIYVKDGLKLDGYHVNQRRQQSGSESSSDPDFYEAIVTDIQPELGQYEWDPIDVPSGWYVLEAEFADMNATSSVFHIANGTDTSCLSTVPSTSDALSHHTNVGAIVGGVIGGVAVVLLALLALLLLRRRRMGAIMRRSRSGSDPAAKQGGWNGLSSREAVAGGVELPKRSHDSSVHSAHSQETAVGDDAGKGSLDKTSMDISEAPVLPYTAAHHDAPRRSGSYGRAHARTASQANRALALATLDGAHLERSMSERTYVGEPLSPPLSPESRAMNRSSSSGANVQRRATRKPVPQYGGGGPDAESPSSPQRSSGMYEGTGANPFAHPNEHLSAAGLNLPRLDHKSSFGEMKPMHVLMPDLPPPQRD